MTSETVTAAVTRTPALATTLTSTPSPSAAIDMVVSRLADSVRVIRMAGLEPGDFFGEMTLIEMQNRSATVVAESPTVLYELTARNLYTCYKADIHAYVMVMQNINRELCRRLRRADNRIAELADASRESMTQMTVRHAG